ncbi:hypothetical protein niasHS_006605 [Heterodera schachtii]|uniref:TLDc domain-containing protein n=1 Tax=Heterodera schachtii TaxID=97005 RepID=A0ABD2JHR2_HETSC
MGNQQSQHNNSGHTNHAKKQLDPRVMSAFNSLSNGKDTIGLEQLKPSIGAKLAQSIWPSLQDTEQRITLKQFVERAETLLNLTPDMAVRMLMPAQKLVTACLEAEGIEVQTEEEKAFLNSLVEHMESNAKTADALVDWKNTNCARMCHPLIERVQSLLTAIPFKQGPKIHSTILNDVQMFILRHALPTTVFFPDPSRHSSDEDWLLLYSSARDGMSTTRFEAKVFDYKGPSVLILRQSSNDIYAIATDEEWRHTSKAFGGPYSVLFQFSPQFVRLQFPPPAISCNFKARSSPLGLSYGNRLLIEEAMANVGGMEVWGCAGAETLRAQSKTKQRHAQQAERNAKVPLPGKWEEEKAILEMAGHRFSSERRD